jgi:drug/metabolite transporter (DMT)-like permease
VGFSLAILTAVLIASSDTLTRKLFQQESAPGSREVMVVRLLVSAPLLLASLPLVGAPPPSPRFWWVIAIGTPLEATALLLYIRAIRIGPLSLALPILAVTPALLLLTGPLLAGDAFSWTGVPGVLLIAAGAYLLHLEKRSRGWMEPLRALARESAARLMFLVAVIYAVTGALGKRGVLAASPGAMAAYYFLALAVVGTAAARPRLDRLSPLVRARPVLCAAVGVTFAAHLFTHMFAVSRMPVAEMIALKRISLLLGSVAGVLLLGEPAPRGRLAGAALMVAGALWIGFHGGAQN